MTRHGVELSDGFGTARTDLSFSVYVPETYDHRSPPGVIVYISPLPHGHIPRGWKSVLEKHNLIYISANNEGNLVPVKLRMQSALVGLNAVKTRYNTDPNVVILSGFSGGARTTSLTIEHIQGIFTGALFIGGAYKWEGKTNRLEDSLKDGAYFFMAGEFDHATDETKAAYRQYKKAGLISKYRAMRNKAHSLPGRRDFEKAVSFLKSSTKHD